ncbi:MAG: DUF47 family protein [Myxococcaceae bacterium]
MLQRLFPKERDFFPIFDRISDCLSDSILELLGAIDGKANNEQSLERVRELEARANRIIRESVAELHSTFVTPFDRSHIFKFFILQGQIVSLSRLLIEKLYYYQVEKLPMESIEIVVQCGKSCTLIRKMVGEIKKIKNPAETLKACVGIYEIIAENNLLAFHASKDLFQDETDIKRLLKIREINSDLISITKKFESVSFLIEEIILEYA